MPNSSTPPRAASRSATKAVSRRAAVSRFESSMSDASPGGGAPRNTTAAATTGPASGPRPASSMPATRPWPDSARKSGRRRTMERR
jgi:hypothetical protein